MWWTFQLGSYELGSCPRKILSDSLGEHRHSRMCEVPEPGKALLGQIHPSTWLIKSLYFLNSYFYGYITTGAWRGREWEFPGAMKRLKGRCENKNKENLSNLKEIRQLARGNQKETLNHWFCFSSFYLLFSFHWNMVHEGGHGQVSFIDPFHIFSPGN